MNKIKLLMPAIGAAAVAGAIVPVVVSCKPEEPIDPSKIKLTLDQEGLNLVSGAKVAIHAKIEPKTDVELEWSISPEQGPITLEKGKDQFEKYVVVSKDAKTGASATIEVSIKGMPEVAPAGCKVMVINAEPDHVVINDGEKEVEISCQPDSTLTLTAKVYDAGGTPLEGYEFNWDIDNEDAKKYFSIDNKGIITVIADASQEAGKMTFMATATIKDTTIKGAIQVKVGK